MADLKPCPFCGGEARIETCHNNFNFEMFRVYCSRVVKCGAMQEWFDTKQEAIEAWNRRANDGHS